MDPTKPAVGALPMLTNLSADLALVKASRSPLVLLFSRSDCAFCHEVRSLYLAPLLQSKPQLIVREVVTDFRHLTVQTKGRPTHAEFGEQMKVRFFPTVYFLNEKMDRVAEPLLGAGKAGFYSAYLDSRIEGARSRMQSSSDRLR